MIDYFTLALMHGLLALAFLRLAGRGDLDADLEATPPAAPLAEPADEHPSRARYRDAARQRD